MKKEIRTRVVETAQYMLKTGATVRRCAAKFGVSKTTIHKDMRTRLMEIDPDLAKQVDQVLGINRRERHLRGGAATRRKYQGKPAAQRRPS